jgi:hypothetical protein
METPLNKGINIHYQNLKAIRTHCENFNFFYSVYLKKR